MVFDDPKFKKQNSSAPQPGGTQPQQPAATPPPAPQKPETPPVQATQQTPAPAKPVEEPKDMFEEVEKGPTPAPAVSLDQVPTTLNKKQQITGTEPGSEGSKISGKIIFIVVAVIIVVALAAGAYYYFQMRSDRVDEVMPEQEIDQTEQQAEEEPAELPDSTIIEPEQPTAAELDSDKDGLTDQEENELGTNPFLKDTDNDNLFDFEEVETYNTDPLNPDSDNDTYLDGEEVTNGFNPLGPGKLFDLEEEIDKMNGMMK